MTPTTSSPQDPAWDSVRETIGQLQSVGRLFLRGQVKLGMQLAALKKEHGVHPGQPKKNLPDSGEYLPWDKKVKAETGYSRQACDVFIKLAEATHHKLKTSKTLALPAEVKKEALTLFQESCSLALTDTQWELVDTVIGSLTTGETQGSLLEEFGLVAKKQKMPKGGKGDGDEDEEELTAGQLAFHFFEGPASALINARSNPDYQKLLYCLPPVSDEEHPLSLATLEAEARAFLADIEEVKQATAKQAKGHVVPQSAVSGQQSAADVMPVQEVEVAPPVAENRDVFGG